MTSKIVLIALIAFSLSTAAFGQNRDEEGTSAPAEAPHKVYPRNILALSPIQFSENGVAGVGVSYERALDDRDIVSFYVPASVVMRTNNNTDQYGNTYNNADPMFYLMPGVKIYPTGGYGMAKYGIGPSLVLGAGQRTDNQYVYNGYDVVTYNRYLFGMMVNQSLNINPTPHLYIGSEFGFGFTYINRENGYNTNTKGLVQFSFKVGYRF